MPNNPNQTTIIPSSEQTEEWAPIKDYEGLYEVSNAGRVRRIFKTGKTKLCTMRQTMARSKIVHLSKENKYLDFGFHELFEKIFAVHFPNQKSCYISGVRTEESPKRMMSLTSSLTYKDITWGKKLNESKGHYTFYPIYDWSYSDVWKYIFDNNIVYNRIYDALFTHGVSVSDMRISNLHHETAIQNLLLIQEIEPNTWNRIA